MRITNLESFTVAIPFKAPLVSAFGISYPARIRTFIKLYTDTGLVGLGETGPGALNLVSREALLGKFEKTIKPLLVGEDPFDRELIRKKLSHSKDAIAVELACWDLIAQAGDVPLYRLLGGQGLCEAVPIAAYCFFRAPSMSGEGAVSLENYVEHCRELQAAGGFKVLKLKLGANSPWDEVPVIHDLRKAVGNQVQLRIDPNGSWSLPTALRMTKLLEDVDLEYIEEPVRAQGPADGTVNTASLKRVRQSTRTPIAADHCYRLDQLAQIIRDEAADVVLADIYGSGGISGTVEYSRLAAAFGLGVALHSGTELSVGQIAKVHIAAALQDEIGFAGDAIYPEYVDDVIVGGKFKITDGLMPVPQTPGLGIQLDEEKLARWELTAQKHRELDEFWLDTKKAYQVGLAGPDMLAWHY